MSLYRQNTILSKLNNCDLYYFLQFANTSNLELRPLLKIPKKVTFGVEIEFENAKRIDIMKDLNYYCLNDFKVVTDGTVMHNNRGGEINSGILTDKKITWKALTRVCDIVNNNNGLITSKTGAHIHFGSQILGNSNDKHQYYINLLKMWVIFEQVIFKFSYGEDENPRDDIDIYAKKCSLIFSKIMLNNNYKDLSTLIDNIKHEQAINNYSSSKRYAINFSNLRISNNKCENRNTIEIRCPNGTINPIIWQNNINFFAKLLLYCSKKIDNNYINYLLNNSIDDLEKAFILSDLIFDNNLDKLYFLKQYLKQSFFKDKTKILS